MNQLLAEAHAVIRSEGADLASRLAAVEQSTRSLFEDIQALRIERDELLAALKQATNGWACYAKRKIELDEIARLHGVIAKVEGR